MGKKSRTKGKRFEEKIARAMRDIFDSPELKAKMEHEAKGMELKAEGAQSRYRALQKMSRVRRSDQGRGAKEPDLVIQGCNCWMELRDAVDPRPAEKLLQAEGDVIEAGQIFKMWPVAITHKTGSPYTQVTMRAATFVAQVAKHLGDDPLVTIDYEDFLKVLAKRDQP